MWGIIRTKQRDTIINLSLSILRIWNPNGSSQSHWSMAARLDRELLPAFSTAGGISGRGGCDSSPSFTSNASDLIWGLDSAQLSFQIRDLQGQQGGSRSYSCLAEPSQHHNLKALTADRRFPSFRFHKCEFSWIKACVLNICSYMKQSILSQIRVDIRGRCLQNQHQPWEQCERKGKYGFCHFVWVLM